jgi:hypothetical protein
MSAFPAKSRPSDSPFGPPFPNLQQRSSKRVGTDEEGMILRRRRHDPIAQEGQRDHEHDVRGINLRWSAIG